MKNLGPLNMTDKGLAEFVAGRQARMEHLERCEAVLKIAYDEHPDRPEGMTFENMVIGMLAKLNNGHPMYRQ